MHSDESTLPIKNFEYETCETQLSSEGFQPSGNHPMQLRPLAMDPNDDLMFKYHKLQRELTISATF